MNVLYTWLGKTDLGKTGLDATQADARLGPVCEALLYLPVPVDRAVLFFDHEPGEEEKGRRYRSWLEQVLHDRGRAVEVVLHAVPKQGAADPSALSWVYETMRRGVMACERGMKGLRRHYLVGPGTSIMTACTILVSRLTACLGSLWQADERGPGRVRPLELPFALRLEDAPDPASAEEGRWQQAMQQRLPAGLVAESAAMRRVLALAERAAASSWPVLILGSTGVGKDVVANFVHCAGPRRDRPFRAINCGAIPAELIESELFGHAKGAFTGASREREGIFEAAGEGTVFLDEVGELPPKAQVTLLRVLEVKAIRRVGDSEERPVACRVVAATHRDLWQAVREGRFREDLYYRLAGIVLEIPDLAERPEDLEAMIGRFWAQVVAEHPGFPGRVLTEAARQRLRRHSWPGNVRELYATLVRAAFLATSPEVDAETVEAALMHERTASPVSPSPANPPAPGADGEAAALILKERLERCRREAIEEALARSRNNKTRAARLLGISPQHLSRLLRAKA